MAAARSIRRGRARPSLTRHARVGRIANQSETGHLDHRAQAGGTPALRVLDGLHPPSLERGTARIHEEDVSAQEALAQARAWLHGPDGYEGRSPRARPPSGQGSQATHRLIPGHAFETVPVLPMLRRRAEFEAIGRDGTARSTPLLVLRWMRTDRAETRIGLSTPRTIGGAVQRNRVRRRLRSLLRERIERIGPGWDLLLIARPAAGDASHAELAAAIDALLARSEIGG